MNFPVDILCRVVDNYGDAGVALRLAKGLSAAAPDLDIRLIVDDLSLFAKLLPGIDPNADVQRTGPWTVVRWSHLWEGFTCRPARLVIESLACGMPEHYKKVLFDPSGTEEILHINLEHLSAEVYAEEFHLLPSFSPIKRIKKFFFLPGFTTDTGGLVIDPSFTEKKRSWNISDALQRKRRIKATSWGLALPPGTEDDFVDRLWINVFIYDYNISPLLQGLTRWDRPKLVFLAESSFREAFFSKWEAYKRPFPIVFLPFLSQEDWDDFLLACDLSLIRGEESLSRAVLSGRPFLWQAYKLDENYQQIKVEALLNKMKPHFPDSNMYSIIKNAFMLHNIDASVPQIASDDTYLRFFRLLELSTQGWKSFSSSLEANGDLAKHLLSFVLAQLTTI